MCVHCHTNYTIAGPSSSHAPVTFSMEQFISIANSSCSSKSTKPPAINSCENFETEKYVHTTHNTVLPTAAPLANSVATPPAELVINSLPQQPKQDSFNADLSPSMMARRRRDNLHKRYREAARKSQEVFARLNTTLQTHVS